MSLYRLIQGYIDFSLAPGGPAAYLSELAPWDHVFKDTIYATTELLGDAVSVRTTSCYSVQLLIYIA